MLAANWGFASSSETDSAAWALEDNVEVHTEDTCEGIILETQIDVLLNTKSEVACIDEGVPVSEKFLFLSSLSLTFSPLSRISSALSPLMVTWTAIFSFLLMPKDRMVYWALELTGFCPAKSSRTFEAAWCVWYLWWVYHRILQRRCWEPAFRFWSISWGSPFQLSWLALSRLSLTCGKKYIN